MVMWTSPDGLPPTVTLKSRVSMSAARAEEDRAASRARVAQQPTLPEPPQRQLIAHTPSRSAKGPPRSGASIPDSVAGVYSDGPADCQEESGKGSRRAELADD